MGRRPHHVQIVYGVDMQHQDRHSALSVPQDRATVMLIHQVPVSRVTQDTTHPQARGVLAAVSHARLGTTIMIVIHQHHAIQLLRSAQPGHSLMQYRQLVTVALLESMIMIQMHPRRAWIARREDTPVQAQQRALHVSRGSSTRMKTLPPPALSVQLAKSAQSVSLHVWIAQQAQPTSVALQRMWHVQPVQRVNMLPHSPQAAQTALPASTTQSGPRHRAKHVRMVAFLKLPPHHARSARQGRVMLTVIQPQRVQRVPLASTLQLDRTELMARSQAVYHVQRVSMMMTATLRRLVCSVLWARCSRRPLRQRAATVHWGSISRSQVRQCALTVAQASTMM